MKIELHRQTGRPVDAEKILKFEADWKAYFDKAELRAKERALEFVKTKSKNDQYMVCFQRFLRWGEFLLGKKYGTFETIDLPQTEDDWLNLSKKYGHAIMLGVREDNGRLAIILLDQSQ